MPSYATRRGARTGVRLWRVLANEPELHVSPDGVMDLVWFRDRLVVAGADTAASRFAARPGEAVFGLQLAPGVAHALLGVPAHELTDRRVELGDVVGLPAGTDAALREDAPDALERLFVALWARADPDRDTLRLAASLDRAARDGLDVRETAARHDVSERTLRRLSGTLFGYGPKTLTRIHRFQRALREARAGAGLGAAAATAGYVDQPHFTREARRLTGRTPSALTRGG